MAKRQQQSQTTTRLMTLHELARAIGVSYWTARDLVHQGHVPVVRLPGRRRLLVDARDLETLVDSSKSTMESAAVRS